MKNLGTPYLSALIVMGLFTPNLAFSSYDQMVTWADMISMDLMPALQSKYGSDANLFEPIVPESAFPIVLRDADNKINKEFHVPAEMRAPVEFWLRIYTVYTTRHVVIFDARHPEVVYEVLDFRDLAKTARNKIVYEIVREKRVKAALQKVRKTLHALTKKQKSKNFTDYEKQILAALHKSKHKHPNNDLAGNVRAQTGQRDNIIKGLLAAELFFPKMERIFANYNVPIELTRLSLVESSFDLQAVSYAGATGVWQFMYKSALEYMIVDKKNSIDERKSPLKSTVAAAKLLARNKKILGNWALAVTSYNHGTRSFRKIAATENFSDISHLFEPCSKKSPLGWASRNYYAEFLALLHAETYRNVFYGEPPLSKPKPIQFKRLAKAQTALQFAQNNGISLQDFNFLNPDIINIQKRLPAGFIIAVPGASDDMAYLLKSPRAKNVHNTG
jgi:membrane-bound lytic murein transglycosylase D